MIALVVQKIRHIRHKPLPDNQLMCPPTICKASYPRSSNGCLGPYNREATKYTKKQGMSSPIFG